MAVTLTNVNKLAAAMRLTDGTDGSLIEPQLGILTRLLAVATETVNEIAPEAPDEIANECVTRMCSYLYDAPTSPMGMQYGAAWRNCGAASLVSRWVTRRAIKVPVDSDDED